MAALQLWFDGGDSSAGSIVAGVHAALTPDDPEQMQQCRQ